ncbi:hypothetical protein MRX96_031509 [Rhipicephalus microplus]
MARRAKTRNGPRCTQKSRKNSAVSSDHDHPRAKETQGDNTFPIAINIEEKRGRRGYSRPQTPLLVAQPYVQAFKNTTESIDYTKVGCVGTASARPPITSNPEYQRVLA